MQDMLHAPVFVYAYPGRRRTVIPVKRRAEKNRYHVSDADSTEFCEKIYLHIIFPIL